MLAHNVVRWTVSIGEAGPLDRRTVAATVRTRLVAIPGRLVNRAGRMVLRAPLDWPWSEWFHRRLDALRLLEPDTG